MIAIAAASLVFSALLPFAAAEVVVPNETVLEGKELLVSDLAGKVTVKGTDGPKIVVRVTRGGADAARLSFASASATAASPRAEFHAVFALGKGALVSYPALGTGSRNKLDVTQWRKDSALLASKLPAADARKIEITAGGGRGAVEAWADLEVLLPAGTKARFLLGSGSLDASDVRAAIEVDAHDATITIARVDGASIDTGSGDVSAREIAGDLSIDTGSGSVSVTLAKGAVDIDTGSGDVTATGLDATTLNVDTGSGSVEVELTTLGAGKHDIDTGSGDVTIRVAPATALRVVANVGSGEITSDIAEAIIARSNRHDAEIRLGAATTAAATTTLRVDTGSGDVTVRSVK